MDTGHKYSSWDPHGADWQMQTDEPDKPSLEKPMFLDKVF